jgi:hypothetical protein
MFTNKEEFKQYLSSSTNKKSSYFPDFPAMGQIEGTKVIQHANEVKDINNLSDYTHYEESTPYISIPISWHTFFVLPSSTSDPDFLAYAFIMRNGNAILPNSSISEIIFNDGKIPSKTGYFTIGDTFMNKGEAHSLLKKDVFKNEHNKDPKSGYPYGATKPTNLVKQVNLKYGMPGDIWVGPLHMKKNITPPTLDKPNPHFGKYQAMAGGMHNQNPHPYLDYNIRSNNKIIDSRSVSKIENMFKYQNADYEKILAFSSVSQAAFVSTSDNKKDTVDELVKNKSIVSEACYSIHPAVYTGAINPDKVKKTHWVHFVFAIDKLKLLKETTKLPGLLDRFMIQDTKYANNFANGIDILHFGVTRINKVTGESKMLLSGDNDVFISSNNNVLKNKTAAIKTGNTPTISFYEFSDREINNYDYNSNEYTYKISLKFKDPLISYMRDRLLEARNVIDNLDELLDKMNLKIYDAQKEKYVDVYDIYQKSLNQQFIFETLNPDAVKKPKLPLSFGFTPGLGAIPVSVDKAFPSVESYFATGGKINSLSALLVFLNDYDSVEPRKNYGSWQSMNNWAATSQYIRNSVTLSNTNPSLVLKVRSLINLLQDRITKALSLYTTIALTKTTTGFTTKDYDKSTNVAKSDSNLFVTEFDYTFKNSIDLSKTKNYFDWIGEAPEADALGGLKTISTADYMNLVTTNLDKNTLLSNAGKADPTVGSKGSFSYSFLPLIGSFLKLFNNDREGFGPQYYQTIRKSLFDNITNNHGPVLIPELLSYFGIKFKTTAAPTMIANPILDPTKVLDTADAGWSDSFSVPFDPNAPPKLKSSKKEEKFTTNNWSFGSMEDEAYAWQGTSIQEYPSLLATSLVNLINSDIIKQDRDIKYFNNFYIENQFNVFGSKQLPYEINLFSTTNIANQTEISHLKSILLTELFTPSGKLRYSAYDKYILFLGLFGKVEYLANFNKRRKDSDMTPSSHYNTNMIKSFSWEPVNAQAITQLGASQQLLCRLRLFEGDNLRHPFFDQKIIDLFRNYFNYNEYFFISRSTIVLETPTGMEGIKEKNWADLESKEQNSKQKEEDRGPDGKDLIEAERAIQRAVKDIGGPPPPVSIEVLDALKNTSMFEKTKEKIKSNPDLWSGPNPNGKKPGK